MLLERKLISLVSDIDETSADVKELLLEEIQRKLESECHLLNQQKELREQWLDNRKLAVAFQCKDLDTDR